MDFKETLKVRWLCAMAIATNLWRNRHASAITNKIIELSIALIVFSVIGVVAISYIVNANTTDWDANTKTLFLLVPVFFVLAVVLAMVYTVMQRK